MIAERIFDTADATVWLVRPRHECRRTGGERLPIERIGIGNVEQEPSRHGLGFTEFDGSIANPQPRVAEPGARAAFLRLRRARCRNST